MLNSSYPFLGRVCLAAVAWGGLACAGETPPTTAPAPPPASSSTSSTTSSNTSASLIPPIKALIGDAACDTSAQCHSIGIGAKACGGPESYVAWSGKNSNENALRAAVVAQAAARKDENLRRGMMSNCAVEPDPGASCQAGRCALRPRGLGGGNSAQ